MAAAQWHVASFHTAAALPGGGKVQLGPCADTERSSAALMLRVLDDGPIAGADNMARDEALLELAQGPTLRLYSWDPDCLSLGLFQDYQRVAAEAPPGLDMVRRITGGGTIYHIHEVTYAIVGHLGQHGFPARVRDTYPLFHSAIAAALASRGAGLERQSRTVGDRRYHQEVRCFASPAADDLVVSDGGKALGSAGRNRGGRFLVHGSLKLASNPWDQDKVAPCGVDAEQAKDCLRQAFTAVSGLIANDGAYTPAERQRAEEIRQLRYGNRAWLEHREGPRP